MAGTRPGRRECRRASSARSPPTSRRARSAALTGSSAPLRAYSRMSRRSSVPMLMSRSEAGAWLTARIISSGRDPVCRERCDERTGRRPDEDVEVVHRRVDAQQIERAERADLVDAAREAAAAEHERRLRRARALLRPASPFCPRSDSRVSRRGELDDVAHCNRVYVAGAIPPHRRYVRPATSASRDAGCGLCCVVLDRSFAPLAAPRAAGLRRGRTGCCAFGGGLAFRPG